MGLTGTHPHRMEDGKVMYMPGKDHETFMKRHEEILKSKAADGTPKKSLRYTLKMKKAM